MNSKLDDFINDIENKKDLDWRELLATILDLFNCTTGTIHLLNPEDDILYMTAYQGIPDFLLPKMSKVPVGKGMAGIAAERKQAIQVCNLQTDESGVVRPSAKDTKVEGAIAMPLMYDKVVYGTFGIAKSEPYEFSKAEIDALQKVNDAICRNVFIGRR